MPPGSHVDPAPGVDRAPPALRTSFARSYPRPTFKASCSTWLAPGRRLSLRPA
jgi:hypothetical protein